MRAGGAVVLAALTITVFPVDAPPAFAAAPLDCSGATIYSVQRGSTASTASDGAIYAFSTSSVGGVSVPGTLVTTLPSGGFANAVGITQGGTAIYAVNQSTLIAGQTIVYRYDAVAATWAQFVGTGGALATTYQAGAVDPANGIYYYVTYHAGNGTTVPASGTLFGFDTSTDTAIAGIVATFDLPSGTGPRINGDIGFDAAGNLFVLSSNGVTSAIGVVGGPLPTTGSPTGVALADIRLTSFPTITSYVGIAFDNGGNLFTMAGGLGVSAITRFNPSTGAVVAGPTPISSADGAQAFLQTDLAACSLPPTLTLQKNIVGRYGPTDQFGLAITGGGITDGITATTTGSATGLQPVSAGPVIAVPGTSYTLAETAVGGNLANYATSYRCTDSANDDAVVASGTGQSFRLPFPDLPPAGESPNVVCRFSNTPLITALTLTTSADPPAVTAAGQPVRYSFLVTNTGNTPLTDVAITETAFSGTGGALVISCPAGAASLAARKSFTCTAPYTATQADVNAGQITNTATAGATSPAGRPITSDPSDATVTAPIPVAVDAGYPGRPTHGRPTVVLAGSATTLGALLALLLIRRGAAADHARS